MEKIPLYDTLSSTNFYIEKIEENREELIAKPHRHKFFEIIFFTNCTGIHNIDFNNYNIENNSIFLIAPGRVHSLNLSDKAGFMFVLSPEFINKINFNLDIDLYKIFYNYLEQPFFTIKNNDIEFFNMLIELIYYEFRKNGNKSQVLYYLFEALIQTILRMKNEYNEYQVENIMKGKYEKYLNRIFMLIEKFYSKEKNSKFYADKIGLTSKRINEILKLKLGKTLTEIIHERIVLEAKRELYFEVKNISEIAYDLGFEDPAYFSRFFKKRSGYSPKKFIEMFK